MSSLFIDLIIGFWLLLFGALALFPLMLDGKSDQRQHSTTHAEDRVISIRPVAVREVRRPQPIVQPGTTVLTQDQDRHDQDHPRRAA